MNTRAERAMLALQRKKDVAPRHESHLYEEAMKAGEGQWWTTWCPLGCAVNPILIDMELLERIREEAKSKRSSARCNFDGKDGRGLLWRGKFFFAPEVVEP